MQNGFTVIWDKRSSLKMTSLDERFFVWERTLN